jgi:hypothetical protein
MSFTLIAFFVYFPIFPALINPNNIILGLNRLHTERAYVQLSNVGHIFPIPTSANPPAVFSFGGIA